MQPQTSRAGAVVLSLFISGGGQILRGRWLRAGLFVAAEYAIYAVMIALILRGHVGHLVWSAVAVGGVRLASAIDAGTGRDGRTGLVAKILSIVFLGLLPFMAAPLVRCFLVEAFRISSDSMAPAYLEGDRVFVDKRPRAVQRGDVVVFALPDDPRKVFVKRVVALEGDALAAYGVAGSVAAGQLFVVGDNRDNSFDSRNFGAIPVAGVRGRVIGIWWRAPR